MESFLDAVDSTPQAVAVEGGIHVETHSLRTPEERHRAACRDHGLRGDAVPQVGGAADDVSLDEHDLSPEASAVGRGLVARGATADDHEAHGH